MITNEKTIETVVLEDGVKYYTKKGFSEREALDKSFKNIYSLKRDNMIILNDIISLHKKYNS